MFLLHHPIWVEEDFIIWRERGHFREHVREKQITKTNEQQQKHKQTNLLDVITFQIVLYYAFGEINLCNLV